MRQSKTFSSKRQFLRYHGTSPITLSLLRNIKFEALREHYVKQLSLQIAIFIDNYLPTTSLNVLAQPFSADWPGGQNSIHVVRFFTNHRSEYSVT